MVISFIFMDLAVVALIVFGVFYIYKNVHKKEDSLNKIKYNMEVFHNPDMVLKYKNNEIKLEQNDFSQNSGLNNPEEPVFSYKDGNDMIRGRIKDRSHLNINDDLAEKTATPFEHGGMNMNNQNFDNFNSTNYFNF